jgi:diguanylate cyclase (GGDEF)-like protein
MKHLIPERQTILVIDDEKANLKILSELFKSKVNIVLAKDGTQGIEKIIKFKPDLILLDIIMPGMSGFEVIMQLKKNEETSAIPVIFITGLTGVVDESQGLALGACDYIQKPFHIDIVRARVNLHLKLAEQRIQLEQLANLDSLTCVPNRRKFYEILDLEWKMSVREKTPLSQIMIDIDYFKQYNDQYGHAAGDQALKKVAQVIFKQLKRPFDFIARYGGEEFVVLLPNTPAQDAINIMESCRQAVENMRIVHEKNPVSKYLTISLGGVNCFPTKVMCSEVTFKLADDMLYLAKGKGRNCAVWYS